MGKRRRLKVGDVAFVLVNDETGETAEVVVAALPEKSDRSPSAAKAAEKT